MEGIRKQRKDDQERIDNFVLVVGLYNREPCILVANYFTINLPSRHPEHVRARLWYYPVTTQSRGYGDVTVTYRHRSEIPSCIYAKHQYRQESEYESTWCFIHSNIWVQLQSYHRKWYNISRILYHQYGANVRIQGSTSMNNTNGAHELQQENSRVEQGGLEG